MDLQVTDKTALVVASSQGLGKAIAEELLKEGANVMLTGRNGEKLAKLAEDLNRLGYGRAAYIKTDITKAEDISAMVKAAVSEFGRLDILVNNAGGPPAGSFEDLSDEDWQNAFELNLLSYIRIIRESLPHLKRNGGKIVNIASSSIKEPLQGMALSNTFRTGIVGLAKTLAAELAPHDILINTVGPGRIATDRVAQLDKINGDKKGISAEEMKQTMLSSIPLGRYGEPEEFARFAAFLVSGANTYMTGQAFLVDGGMVKSI
ncbi:SDR family oxidoreductase [Bacillus sp. MUM 13]|uniref:SDR family oxidoreductase n=1 Tax=Bacillus sp. MUM 13 TaxID=1678001 RepID=UPI0008F5E867|nr:SDR family oxidoreductase [Bacillus sp. MUM 13]OIK05205.1 3-oxoacyl-ACP reductase [Bacillus sp. MUM 13]